MNGRHTLPAILFLAVGSVLFYACGPATPSAPTSHPPTNLPVPLTPTLKSTAIPGAAGKLALGYYTGSQGSYAALLASSTSLNMVSADVFTLRSDGSIAGSDDLGAAAFGRSRGIQTYACLNNYNSDPGVNDFDPHLAQAAIVTYKTQVISSLVDLAQQGGFDGINIDIENLNYSANIEQPRADFTSFIHQLAGQLHARAIKLIISVPAKTADSKDDAWSYPFDLAALGQDADYLQLMTYDQHGPWSEPGPVSGADWVEDSVIYASSVVYPSRLLVGLPAYGYDWDLTSSDKSKNTYSAHDFSWTDVPALLAKPAAAVHWDAGSQSPYVTYTVNGHDHVAWYENPQSIRAKTELITKYNLAGFAMWALGKEDQGFWQASLAGTK